MIVVKLMGGLGNQMFQYAAGRSLACRLGVELRLDVSCLEALCSESTPRRFELNCFNIAADMAGIDDVESLIGKNSLVTDLRAKVSQRLGLRWERPHFYREPHYQYDEYFERLPDNTYLAGYWHSERYFAHIADRIAAEFTWRSPLSGLNLEIASRISAVESASIHVRRGDYVENHKTNQYHGVCSLEYYRSAVTEMALRTDHPHFFVFSDDPDWVKRHLQIAHPTTFVTCNGIDKGHEDLRLMSLCKHQIIANSSFSWWGAWLNKNPGKLVFAPENWFADPGINTSDLIPESWLVL